MQSFQETKRIIRTDIYRNCGEYSEALYRKLKRQRKSTVSLLVYFRLCNYYANKEHKNIIEKFLHGIDYLRFQKLCEKCGVELNQRTQIGEGLRLPHKGGIIIHPQTVIGKNCEIMQGVTFGNNILKSRDLVPVVGDEVLICAGAKLIGGIQVGDHVVIGANAVVNKDVASNRIVAGVPAKEIRECQEDFVINKDENI